MYLRDKKSGDVVEVTSLDRLFDPFQGAITGRFHRGEELQEEDEFAKAELQFLSGESLPRCWVDSEYRALA